MTLGILVCTVFAWNALVFPMDGFSQIMEITSHISKTSCFFYIVANPCDSSEINAVIRTNRNLWEDWTCGVAFICFVFRLVTKRAWLETPAFGPAIRKNKLEVAFLKHWVVQLVQLKYFFFVTPNLGEDSHFDWYFSNGLKPPTRTNLWKSSRPNNSWLVFRLIHGSQGFPTYYQWASRLVDLDFWGLIVVIFTMNDNCLRKHPGCMVYLLTYICREK